jgi:hypothetical protein
MSLYQHKRTARIFLIKSDNVALSLLMPHSAKLAFPAGRSAKMWACQPQRDITASAIGVIQIL